MKEPKHWKELSKDEKERYWKQENQRIIVQWVLMGVLIVTLIFAGSNFSEFKDYQNPCAYCLAEYEDVSCRIGNDPMKLEGKKVVVEKSNVNYFAGIVDLEV